MRRRLEKIGMITVCVMYHQGITLKKMKPNGDDDDYDNRDNNDIRCSGFNLKHGDDTTARQVTLVFKFTANFKTLDEAPYFNNELD